jgi:hypothetical protein
VQRVCEIEISRNPLTRPNPVINVGFIGHLVRNN